MNWITGASARIIRAKHNDTEYLVTLLNERWNLYSRRVGTQGHLYPLKIGCLTKEEAMQAAEEIIKF